MRLLNKIPLIVLFLINLFKIRKKSFNHAVCLLSILVSNFVYSGYINNYNTDEDLNLFNDKLIGQEYDGLSSSSSDDLFNKFKLNIQHNSNNYDECKTDSNCINSHSICLNGSCVRICNSNDKYFKNSKCIYFHCDSKLLITPNNNNNDLDDSNLIQKLARNLNNANLLIETNNYPLLNRYLKNKKCSWILKHSNSTSKLSNVIELNFDRFSTELANDYLYIFAGDSVFSPLIAALSGNTKANLEPSLAADTNNDQDINDLNDGYLNQNFNVTFFNTTSLYLLFKSDTTSSSIFNTFNNNNNNNKETNFFRPSNSINSKPNGISIKYKFSSPCLKNSSNSTNECFDNDTRQSNSSFKSSSLYKKLIETIYYNDDETNHVNNLNSKLRRGLFCSFEYKNYYYVIGGYSFVYKSQSFVSRLDLNTLKWEHSLDRKPSTVVNRANRRFFSSFNFKHPRLDLPESRYAHSCVVDEENNHFYMFGGIKYKSFNGLPTHYINKQTTNELWSYNLETNKWLLLNLFNESSLNSTNEASNSNTTTNLNNNKSYVLPIPVSGHSIYLHKNSLYIFFGYSEYYGSFLNLIQEYKIDQKTWKAHNISSNIKIGYSHSSVIDKEKQLIYFLGGLCLDSHSNNSYEYHQFSLIDKFYFNRNNNNKQNNKPKLSPYLYTFDLNKFEWKLISKSTLSSYMQSTLLFNDTLLVYGGISINDNKLVPEISNELNIFDIEENEWLVRHEIILSQQDQIFKSTDRIKFNKRERYAHGSFIYNNSIYIFAGFNGFFLNDLFKFDLMNLRYFKSRDENQINKYLNTLRFRKKKKRNIFSSSFDQSNQEEEEDNFGNKIPLKSSSFISSSSNIDFINNYEPLFKNSYNNSNLFCNRFSDCNICHLHSECVWNSNKCEYYQQDLLESHLIYQKPICSQMCSEYTSCYNCTYLSMIKTQGQSDCVWCSSQSKCLQRSSMTILYPFGECMSYISEKMECDQDVYRLERNHILGASISSYCSTLYTNCSSCIQDERCGWCSKDTRFNMSTLNSLDSSTLFNHSMNTGYGICMEGGESGSSNMKCKSNWYFSSCPTCECNGHSTCSSYLNQISSPQCSNCLNNTEGEYCSQCKKGYYGNPKNNGTCQKCDCGNQADYCDTQNGRCLCHTKGVIGGKCDQCDQPRYTGRPNLPDGSCFYNLTTDYQFTFNLNKDSDRYYSRINFVNHPTKNSDDDIDFMVRCFRENAIINVTYVIQYNHYDLDNQMDSIGATPTATSFTDLEWPFNFFNNFTTFFMNNENNTSSTSTTKSPVISASSSSAFNYNGYNYYFGPISSQVNLLTQINCTTSEFKYTFSNRDLNYADKNRNAVFIVYVHNFQSPITIQIAFSRKSRVQLLHFFITFFGCLLTLLTVAFISWKTKQRYDRYRRQRQIVTQMENMASRPFTRLLVDVTKTENTMSSINDFKETNLQLESSKSKGFNVEFKYMKNSKKSSKKYNNDSLNKPVVSSSSNSTAAAIANKLRIMPVAVEPMSNNKSAILTCLLKLPQGDLNYVPKGSSPFVLASAYVQLSSSSPFLNFNNNNDSNLVDDDEQNKNQKNEKQF